MSADNGIYIAQFPDGWRVIHAMAIENLDFYEYESEKWRNEWRNYFGRSAVYTSLGKAQQVAYELATFYYPATC